MADLEAPQLPRRRGVLPTPVALPPTGVRCRTLARSNILHCSAVALLSFHVIFTYACVHRVLAPPMPSQIAAYPAIACLYIWAPSRRSDKIASAVFLAALALIVVFVSISAGGLPISVMFVANVVAMSTYCAWKLYPIAKPWIQLGIQKLARFLPAPAWQDEEEGLLLPPQLASFRIQDLPREFSYGEVRAMTRDFEAKVGQGGSGQVFRGQLSDGTPVAVKRIATAAGEADDFLREISTVANVHHRSLVRLLGYCLPPRRGNTSSSSSRYLVYPFFENGSLDTWLFDGGEERRRRLTWPARRRAAVDVARALAYLHHECRLQILHLDVKPGNVLLDGDLRAYVSDFGISVSVDPGMSSVDTRGRGTPGYMPPEMLVNAVSAKSDVFSYGMTLLELVGGRRNFEPSSGSGTADASSAAAEAPDLARDFFPCVVREKMARGEVMEVVDAAMAEVDREEVEAVVRVALCCIQRRWDMRPTMLTVVDMLEGRVAADLPPESPMSSSLAHGR
ncbi:unnamed protein product [Urochloa decumbens]|uniref:Protein kinase domain-containing protein n=1 Tax=Urochloa decumbens TaxID=240449 RepID=A0ABC9E160_9POAL